MATASIPQTRNAVDNYILHDDLLMSDEQEMLNVVDVINAINSDPSTNPLARNALVFGPMSQNELNAWADKVYDPGVLGIGKGLTADQRGTMFTAMSANFDGQLLGRMTTTFDREPGDVIKLGEAIANNTKPEHKRDFIVAIARDIAGPEVTSDHGIFGDTVTRTPNEMAQVAVKVMVSLKASPDEYSAAYNSLQAQGKLDEVVEAAAYLEQTFTVGFAPAFDSSTVSNDVSQLKELVTIAHASGDARTCTQLANAIENLRLNIHHGQSEARSYPQFKDDDIDTALTGMRDQLRLDALMRPMPPEVATTQTH
jgi:hypothetical protein